LKALVILLLVARGEANDPTTRGAARAARELLGSNVEVSVREVDSPGSDVHALELGKASDATAVIEVTWESPEHRQARIHFHLEPHRGWNDRVIMFASGDDPAERGRTVGLAVASMLPGSMREKEPASATPEPTTEARPETDRGPAAVAGAPSGPHRWQGSIDAMGAASLGLAGEAPGWGGSVGGRWYLSHPWGIRIGLSARTAHIDVASAELLHVHVAAGVVWLPLSPTAKSPFELGARAGLLAIRESMRHDDADDPESITASRWLPGAEAAFEVSWLFRPQAAVGAAAGAELAFGGTDVTLHQRRVATLPPTRLLFELGVRTSF